jgi:hypothetical protein
MAKIESLSPVEVGVILGIDRMSAARTLCIEKLPAIKAIIRRLTRRDLGEFAKHHQTLKRQTFG